jgi:uncharacterized protein (DUF305 family)
MEHRNQKQHGNHYTQLGLMAALSFAAMYWLMYAMVNSTTNVYMSLNQIYMAAVMTAPMVVIELIVMRMMYKDAGLNRILIGTSLVVGVAAFLLIRQQTAIGDRQFLRSMIPHHSAAILMCERAPISDAEIQALCRGIVETQRSEIDRMVTRLRQLQASR